MIRVTPEVAESWALDNLGRMARSSQKPHKFRVHTCPICGHTKSAAVLNTRTQMFECYRHGGKHTFFELVRTVEGMTSTADAAVLLKLRPYAPAGIELIWAPPRRDALIAPAPARVRTEPTEQREDDWQHFSTDWTTHDGKVLAAYARQRNLTDEWLDSGRIGYFRRGRLAGRLAFVTLERGRPVLAVCRSVRKVIRPKYLMSAGADAANYVFNLDLVPEGGRALVNEGCLSAISSGPGGVAVFGNEISWTQAGKIGRRCSEAIVIVEQGIEPLAARENAHRLAVCGVRDVLIAKLATEADPNDDEEQMPAVIAGAVAVPSVTDYLQLRLQRKRIS